MYVKEKGEENTDVFAIIHINVLLKDMQETKDTGKLIPLEWGLPTEISKGLKTRSLL